jgi:uncharacterized membrane protein YhfC
MAGIFEETGGFTAFKLLLKKNIRNDNSALMYGAGHGGFEAFYILVFSMVSNIVTSIMLNSGNIDKITGAVTDEERLGALYASFAALATTPPATFLMATIERIAAVALHMSLSVLVWFAVKLGGKRLWFLILAIFIHAFVNSTAVILSKHLSSVWIILAIIYVLSAFSVALALKTWKKCAAKPAAFTPAKSGKAKLVILCVIGGS